MINIPQDLTLHSCEEIGEALRTNSDEQLALPLSLLANGALGLDARLSQLIVQWSRTRGNPTLILPDIADSETQTLAALALSSYGLTALALAKEVKHLSGSTIPQKQIRTIVSKRLEDLNARDISILAKSEGFSFLSIYGHPAEYGDWLFTKNSDGEGYAMQTPIQIGSWLSNLINFMLPEDFQGTFDEERRKLLSVAAYELLENANQHGRYNEYAESLSTGVFGINARVIKVSYDTIGPLFSGASKVGLYFLERVRKDRSKQDLFLELSIFDSGIGYHNWINATCNSTGAISNFRGLSEEQTVRACLFRHATSKDSDGSGIGLFRVIRLLKKLFGFIRIRTGTTCLYARLDQAPSGELRRLGMQYDDSETNEAHFKNWFEDTQLPESTGTTVTICCPLTSWR